MKAKQTPILQPSTTTIRNYVFRVHLPDAREEDVRVEFDKTSRKITVRNPGVVARADVPADADVDLVGAQLEHGWLSLLMPRKTAEMGRQRADPPSVRRNASQKDYDSDEIEQAAPTCGTKERPMGGGQNGERPQDAREKASLKAAPTKSAGRGKSTPSVSRRNPIDEIEEWLDQSGTLQKLMESFNKNKGVVAAAAAVGFSVGFIVAHKLRPSSG